MFRKDKFSLKIEAVKRVKITKIHLLIKSSVKQRFARQDNKSIKMEHAPIVVPI